MFRTKFYLASVVLFFLISNNPSLVLAEDEASRDVIIQKQMDCVSHHLKNTSVDWQDLCDIPDTSTQNQTKKLRLLTTILDAVSQEFSNTQTYQKESPNARPEMQSAGGTLKDILSPDLSQNPGSQPPSNVKTRVNDLDAGSEIFYYRYQEPTPGEGVKIHGPMYGYYADYAYRPASPNVLNNFLTNVYSLQARYATSHDLEYNGSGIVKGKYDDAMEFRGLIGKDYFVDKDSRVTPYFGFGYRYLLDRGNGELSSIGDYGYDRKSHYYYLPLGGDAVIEMPNNWEIDSNIEYDILLQGLQKSYLSDGDQFTGYNNPNFTNSQNQGFGLRASIKFLKHFSLVDFYVEPYVRFWNIEQSDAKIVTIDGVTGSAVEPKNNTTEIGSRFGIQF